jgi:hypothetical protein
VLGQVGFESLGELTPGQKDTPPTAPTLQPDVRAKTDDGPLIGTARMLFAQAELIVETQVG